GLGVEIVAVDPAVKAGRQPAISRFPGHLIDQIGVRPRHGELAKPCLQIYPERSTECGHRAAQAERPIADPPLEIQASRLRSGRRRDAVDPRSEEHTSELQSRGHLVCRLLLEKKKKRHRLYAL